LDRTSQNNLISLQAPIRDGSMGVGFQALSEQVNLLNTVFIAGSAAYHLGLNDQSSLSFGLQITYAQSRLNNNRIQVVDFTDPLILNFPGYQQLDFVFGATYRVKQFTIAASANRLGSMLSNQEQAIQGFFPGFFTLHTSYQFILFEQRDVLEPKINYRSIGYVNTNLLDVGFNYTYGGIFTGTFSYRNTGSMYFGAAMLFKNLSIGYARETRMQQEFPTIGGSDEITVTYQFATNARFSNPVLAALNKKVWIKPRKIEKPDEDNLNNRLQRKPKKVPATTIKEKRKVRKGTGKYKN
jgi:type IX secretion system PorP/SprF family membrane protein